MLFFAVFNPILTGSKEFVSTCALIHLKIVAQSNLQRLLRKFVVTLLKMNLCKKGKHQAAKQRFDSIDSDAGETNKKKKFECFRQNRTCPFTVTTSRDLSDILRLGREKTSFEPVPVDNYPTVNSEFAEIRHFTECIIKAIASGNPANKLRDMFRFRDKKELTEKKKKNRSKCSFRGIEPSTFQSLARQSFGRPVDLMTSKKCYIHLCHEEMSVRKGWVLIQAMT